MGTRGLFSFVDEDKNTFHVYKHADCYPHGPWGGIASIMMATRFSFNLPRFEASEFAAAFVCATKMSNDEWRHMQLFHEACDARQAREAALERGARSYEDAQVQVTTKIPSLAIPGGGTRLLKSGHWAKVAPWDIEYHYTVHQDKAARPLTIWAAKVVEKDDKMADEILFKGTLPDAMAWAMELQRKEEEEINKPVRTGRLRPARMLL